MKEVRKYTLGGILSLLVGLVFGFSFVRAWIHEFVIRIYLRDFGSQVEAEVVGVDDGRPAIRVPESESLEYMIALGSGSPVLEKSLDVRYSPTIPGYVFVDGAPVFDASYLLFVVLVAILFLAAVSYRGPVWVARERMRKTLRIRGKNIYKKPFLGFFKLGLSGFFALLSVGLGLLPFFEHGLAGVASNPTLLTPLAFSFPALAFSVFLFLDSFFDFAERFPGRFAFLEKVPLFSEVASAVLLGAVILGVFLFIGYMMFVEQIRFSDSETSQAIVVDRGCHSRYWISCTAHIKVEYNVDGLYYWSSIPYNDIDHMDIGEVVYVEWNSSNPSLVRLD